MNQVAHLHKNAMQLKTLMIYSYFAQLAYLAQLAHLFPHLLVACIHHCPYFFPYSIEITMQGMQVSSITL